jgi:hypothetical protein
MTAPFVKIVMTDGNSYPRDERHGVMSGLVVGAFVIAAAAIGMVLS